MWAKGLEGEGELPGGLDAVWVCPAVQAPAAGIVLHAIGRVAGVSS